MMQVRLAKTHGVHNVPCMYLTLAQARAELLWPSVPRDPSWDTFKVLRVLTTLGNHWGNEMFKLADCVRVPRLDAAPDLLGGDDVLAGQSVTKGLSCPVDPSRYHLCSKCLRPGHSATQCQQDVREPAKKKQKGGGKGGKPPY